MPKAYWIGRIDVTDDASYAEYRKLNGIAFAKYGAKFLARGPVAQNLFGTPRTHNVIIEFASLDQARACYNSAEYQAAKVHLGKVGPTELIIVEGYEGAQP